MSEEAWTHHRARLPGLEVHYVRAGHGAPLILLHGWPEFWRTWRKNIGPLSRHFDVVAPDLRGFGDTEKPAAPLALDDLVADLGHLADHLGFTRFGIVAHDVGAWIAQAFARRHPERLSGLFFFNVSYPGIGKRWAEADHLIEIWYQSFHQLPLARALVGYNRDTVRLYVRHFLTHWAGDVRAFDEDVEAYVDNFMKPGNLDGGFKWYTAINATRLALIRDGAPKLAKIPTPTRVLWGTRDPLYKTAWTDLIPEYFADVRVDLADGAGHFVHYEKPDLANKEIIQFFKSR